ncbi:uncharacterized protein F4807DRAFT_467948 [Annulohypoxylon truncatum]|uniref:uncharacterized protein n=1 Tax=Annulohypoxylon truncatum TaxID=327061 RepID=UPI002008C428|nr:uncharacterized protein F4807DRAFT_467948 [Annulohypoxylon truncatum]KAI1208973.1 hypothetical protein F4807DRAFT_467948 [Annulohypoxylon truncatum]
MTSNIPAETSVVEDTPPSRDERTESATSTETAEPSSLSETDDPHSENSEQSTGEGNFRASRFAKKSALSQWFPQIEYDEHDSRRIYFSRRGCALLLQIVLIGLVFTANLGLTIFANIHYKSQNGVGTIYEGDCNKVKTLDQWLHLLINFLGTGMLTASNYCMQLQAAPTREDIDRAHEARAFEQNPDHTEGRWLDIGVPSLRNLRYVSPWRRFGWFLLALSSIPIHLMYNSAVFQSLASNDYTIAVVKDSFVNGSPWNLATAENNRRGDVGWDESRVNPVNRNYTEIIQYMQDNVMGVGWEELNISACYALYNDYFTAQGNGVIFVKNDTGSENDTLLMYVSIIPRSDDWAKNMWAALNGSSAFIAGGTDNTVTTWFLGPKHYEVASCRVQSPDTIVNHCRFEYSSGIMLTVCVLNFTKLSVMLFIWVLRRWQETKRSDEGKTILYTLGDAIASFMRKPDPTTINLGLATKDDFIRGRTWKSHLVKEPLKLDRNPRRWVKKDKYWFTAGSIRRWVILIFLYCLTISVAAILLGVSFTSLHRRNFSTSIPALYDLGFGQLTPYTYLVIGLPREDPKGLVLNVLLANLPQLIISILYTFYNAMLSTFLVQLEFSRMYLDKRKPLRVSEPVGIQRSSFFISLPLRYGIPLYAIFALLHWLISQSLFLARITAICADGDPEVCPGGQVDLANSFSTCGYSPFAIFITLLVAAVIVLAIVVLGFRTYDGTMSMVSTNSMAISAACHVLKEDQEDGYLLPVQWGVVEIRGRVGKCAFTTAPSRKMKMPEPGLEYS